MIDGSGVLNAIGTDCGGVGIGGGYEIDCGNIVIEGGVINAAGGASTAGIGAGIQSVCGEITINGGTVTATGGYGAAGIGSGYWHSDCAGITIGAGIVSVTATRGSYEGSGTCLAIGNGIYSDCGSVTVHPSLVDRTSADGMTRTITAAGNTDFLPGDRTTNAYSTRGEAETAAAGVQIVAPADVQAGLTSGDLADYLECFTKKVVQNPDGEGYVIVVALTDEAEETLQEQADDDVAGEILPSITSSEVTITTTPGFYYSVMWGDEPDCPDQTMPVLATGTSLTLELPKGENPAATFYKLVIDFTR
jgi:hypothetical protein